jgi:PAS domain S-box-containing protein
MTYKKILKELVPLKDIISIIPGSTYWKDTKLRYRGCNESAKEIVGLKSCDDIVGMTDYDIAKLLNMPTSIAEKFRRDDEYVIHTKKPLLNQIEPKFKVANGNYIIQMSNRVPIIKEGKVVGILGNSIDITSYAESMNELKINKSKLQYLQQKHTNMLENFSEKFIGLTKKKYSMEEYIMNIQLYLDAVFSHLPCHIYWIDTNGVVRGSNEQMAISFGYSRAFDIVGMTLDQLLEKIHGDKKRAKVIHEKEQEIIRTKKGLTIEEVGELADGKVHYFLTHKCPLVDARGNVIGILGVSMDITDRKKMEQDLQKAKDRAEAFNKLKSKFISNMEHDLRTPLSGLEATIAGLLTNKTEGMEKQTLEFSLSSIEELKIIINSILDFENQQYGCKVLNKPFKLSQVFESIHRLYHPTANSKHLKLSYTIDSKLPRVLISDEWRIKHILLNLVGNALKFTNEGEVFFEAKLIRHEGRNVLIEFVVKDTGIGIPEDKRDVIFERYVRLEGSNKGRYKGTGLGLANVKEYVEQLDGEFRPIQSQAGKGTTLAILIPMKESLDQDMPLPSDEKKNRTDDVEIFHAPEKDEKKLEAAEHKRQEDKLERKPIKKTKTKPTVESEGTTLVLLVEDSPPAQFMGKIAIKGANCDVDVAGTAEDALKMIEEKNYDLVFADIGLPGMDGIEMTRHIRYEQRKKGERPTPIVGQSANTNTKVKKSCIEAGMQDLLAKPLTPTNVSDVLRNYTQHFIQKPTTPPIPKTIKNPHVIDFEALKSLWKGKDNLREVLEQTKALTFKDIDDLKAAFANKDWKQLLFLAHKLRGGFIYVAASRVEEACSYLEEYLSSTSKPDEKSVKTLYQMLLTELDTAWQALDKWVN